MSLTDLTDKIFSEIVESAKEKYRRENWRGTFDQFLAKLAENPERYLRTSYKYIYDAIVHFGKEEIKDCGETLPHYHVFDDPFGNGRKKIFGQHRLLESLVDEIRSSAEEEGPERIILLHGPPGTAKTSIMYLISKAMEFYSRTEEGELLRFKWKISNRPIDPGRQSKIGFQTESGEDGEKSSSKKKKSPKKRGVEMVCSLNDNPIFLIPAEQREEFLRKIIGDRDITVPKKILEGEICYNCRQIYNALLDKYHGDLEKVFQHIVVERFFIEDNQGFILIEPGTMEDPFHMQFKVLSEKIARFLPGVVVQPLGGRWAASNRGLIHFSDIFKPNTGHYQLLSASEEHRVTINGISVNVDTLIGGTCNIEDYESLKKNPLSGGLRDRIRRFGVNYVLNFKDEEKIYLRDLSGVKKKHIAPHSVSLAALWAVLTRLDKPIEEGLPENIALSEKAKQLLLGVNPMQKAEIYAGKERHEFEYFGEDEVKLIDDNFRKALKYTEGLLEQAYNYAEGTFGISPRKIQDLFKKILKKGQCLDPVTVLEGIEKLILEEKSDHDFLAWEEALKSEFSNNEGVLAMFTSDSLDVGSYFNSHKALVWVKNYYEEKIRHEVCFALLDLKPERLDRLIRDYIENVELAVINPDSHGESNSKDRADFGLLEEIETKLGYDQGTDDLEKYRREVIARFHEYVKQFPPAETGGINYRKALPDLYEDLYHALFAEKSDAMDFENLQEAVYRYNTESFGDMEMCVRKEAERVIDRMKEFYGYCDVCAKKTLLYAFKSIEDIFF